VSILKAISKARTKSGKVEYNDEMIASLPEDELVGVTIAQATRGSYLKAYNRLNHRPTLSGHE